MLFVFFLIGDLCVLGGENFCLEKSLEERFYFCYHKPKFLNPGKEAAMEVYPFHHQNLFFNIITDYDLRFEEVRAILDYLLQVGAFREEGENWEGGKFYDIPLGQAQYEVDVNGFEVVIYRKTEL